MGEDKQHIIKDVNGNYWEEDSKGLWWCVSEPDSTEKLTFTALASAFRPIRIFVELT